MTHVSAAMAAEAAGLHRLHMTLDLTFGLTSPTTIKLAKAAVASESNGLYERGVQRFGRRVIDSGFPGSDMRALRANVLCADEDRVIQDLIGANGSLEGSQASLWMRSFYVPVADHTQIIDGQVLEVRMPDRRHFELVVGPPSADVLDGSFKIPRLAVDDWPNIPAENVDKPGQIVVGKLVTAPASESAGMVRAHLVDAAAKTWYVSEGTLGVASPTDGLTVYVNGASGSTTWIQSNVTVRGVPKAVIIQQSGTTATIDDDVTCDVYGLDANGDGSAAVPEERPGHVLELILTNFVFNRWPASAPLGVLSAAGDQYFLWITPGTHINTSKIDAIDTYFALNGQAFSAVITSDTDVRQFLSNWVESFREPVFWDETMKVAAAAFDYGVLDDAATKIFRDTLEIRDALSYGTKGDQKVGSIDVSWLYDWAMDAPTRTEQLRLGTGKHDEFMIPYGRTFT